MLKETMDLVKTELDLLVDDGELSKSNRNRILKALEVKNFSEFEHGDWFVLAEIFSNMLEVSEEYGQDIPDDMQEREVSAMYALAWSQIEIGAAQQQGA